MRTLYLINIELDKHNDCELINTRYEKGRVDGGTLHCMRLKHLVMHFFSIRLYLLCQVNQTARAVKRFDHCNVFIRQLKTENVEVAHDAALGD